MTKIKAVLEVLEQWAPPALQEHYDNCGLLTGNADADITGILVTLDVTEAVMEEALRNQCNLVVAHHPVIFQGLKKLTGATHVERIVMAAIKNDIAIYAIHTNLDNVRSGVNQKIAQLLGLEQTRILQPKAGNLLKLVTFVPQENTQTVLNAMHGAGAGKLGDYRHCSFRTAGTGAFMPNDQANPHLGQANTLEQVQENRVEVILPVHLQRRVVKALLEAHPYEEVAYDIFLLQNDNQETGSGIIGTLPQVQKAGDFVAFLKKRLQLTTLRHTALCRAEIKTVALCGGSGSFLLAAAIRQGADVFVSADFKYHEFFQAEGKIIVADVGHYESEQFTKDLIYDALSQNFTNIALHLSKVVTNPIFYA
jgi:dinuclear metal center YbgI/SA1388 family protein